MSNLTTSIQITRTSRHKLNNGYSIPVIGFGTYEIPKADTKELVYQALVDGYRHIDSAVGYQNEEEAAQGIQKFIADSNGEVTRKDIWFTTKITNQMHGYEKTQQEVEGIAKRVKKYIDYVDLVLIHSPKSSKELRLGTWKALQEYVSNPTNPVLNIHSIGVSNFGIKHIKELLEWDGLLVKPVLDQLELHPWSPQLKLREYLVENDLLVEAYSPLARGSKLNDPELLQLEHTYKVPKGEILLKWSFIQGFIVLVKSVNKDRIKQNISVLPEGSHHDTLDDDTHFGKVDLDVNILDKLNKPDSHEITTWGGQDPTLYEDE